MTAESVWVIIIWLVCRVDFCTVDEIIKTTDIQRLYGRDSRGVIIINTEESII